MREKEREREREGLLTVHTQTGDYTHTHLASKLPLSVTIQCFNQQNQTVQYLGLIVNRHVTVQKSHYENMFLVSVSNPRAPYIVGGHANRASLLMKSSPALTLQLWDRSPAQDSQVFQPHCSGQNTDHSPWTLGSAGFSLLLF